MSPVADMDLSAYLSCADVTRYGVLRTFFGCLARALEFLHSQGIRHKDIKPGNILVYGRNILFTDFGLALDFMDAEGSTTVETVNGMTPRYCSPEVANHEPRNTSSDIWNLGVVFLEIFAVLKGRTVEWVYGFLAEHGSRQAYVRTNHVGLRELLRKLQEMKSLSDNVALGWIQDMLMMQPNLRPTAASLIASITTAGGSRNGGYCGICCMSLDDPLDDFDKLAVA
jgi:serine/threonine protein kinase